MNKLLNYLGRENSLQRGKFKKRWIQPVFKDDPNWVKHVPYKELKRFRKKEELAERELFEARKQLFNSEKSRPSISSKNEPGLLRIRHKFTNPDLPHPNLKRLIARCRQNVEFWIKEQEEKDKKVKEKEREINPRK